MAKAQRSTVLSSFRMSVISSALKSRPMFKRFRSGSMGHMKGRLESSGRTTQWMQTSGPDGAGNMRSSEIGLRITPARPNDGQAVNGRSGGDYGFVSLRIFDLLGKVVAALVNENLHTGVYSVPWDAAGLPGGVYFYQLRAGTFVETRKMILLR